MIRLARLLGICLLCGSVRADLDIAGHLSADAILEGEFLQENRVPGLKHAAVARGRFVYLREHGLYWRVETPMAAAWLISVDGIKRPDGSTPRMSNHISRLIIGLLDMSILDDARFTHTVKGDLSAWQVRLEPAQKSVHRYLKSVRVEGGEFLDLIAMDFPDGRYVLIRLQKVTRKDMVPAETCSLFRIVCNS